MKSQFPAVCCLLLLTACLISGCAGNQYEIDLQPTDGGIERSLTCWRTDSNHQENVHSFPAEELQQIAAAYDANVGAAKKGKHKFTSLFTEMMPDDIGGSGSYRRWETSLGSVSIYVERFRGDDDLLTELENRLRAIDTVVDLLLGWLTGELKGEAGFEQLQKFMNDQFRRDFKNLCLYAFVPELLPDADNMDQAFAESVMRAGHFLVERSYFSIDELPKIARALQEQESTGHSQQLLMIVQRLVASKLGVADQKRIPDCLNFLAHDLAIKKSIEDYLRSTAQYATLLQEWEETQLPDELELEVDDKPAPTDVIGNQLTRAFFPGLFAQSDTLTVRFTANSRPFLTNGRWDDDNKQVHWTRSMLASDAETFEYPTFLFALCSEPNTKAQKDRFGKTVLDGEALGNYCLWHRSLDKGEAKEWETFLLDFAGTPQFIKQLDKFRFSHEPPAAEGDDEHGDLAATARDLIKASLTE